MCALIQITKTSLACLKIKKMRGSVVLSRLAGTDSYFDKMSNLDLSHWARSL